MAWRILNLNARHEFKKALANGLAALLGCLLGPIGLLYSTGTGAIVMFVVNLVGLITIFGLFLTWPICGLWGYLAAKTHNKKLLAGNK